MPIPDTTFTLVNAKAHLRVFHSEEDALITAMLDAAVERCEEWTGKAWTDRAIEITIPPSSLYASRWFLLPLCPAKVPVTSFKYAQVGSATLVDVPADTYRIRTVASGMQYLEVDSLPSDLDTDAGDCLFLSYTAEPAGAVPAAVIHAAYLFLGDLYLNRESSIVGTIISPNPTAIALLAPHRVNLGM